VREREREHVERVDVRESGCERDGKVF